MFEFVSSDLFGYRLGSAKPTAVIIEGKKLSEDEEEDDEQFVVEETAPVPSDMPDLQAVSDLAFCVSRNNISSLYLKLYCQRGVPTNLYFCLQEAVELQGDENHGKRIWIVKFITFLLSFSFYVIIAVITKNNNYNNIFKVGL